jgi:ribosomal protein S27AE
MAKVTGEKMTEAERAGLRTWFCQTCGGELDEQLSADPSGRLKCGKCASSWWAIDPPDDDDVAERMEARKAEQKREEDRAKKIAARK